MWHCMPKSEGVRLYRGPPIAQIETVTTAASRSCEQTEKQTTEQENRQKIVTHFVLFPVSASCLGSEGRNTKCNLVYIFFFKRQKKKMKRNIILLHRSIKTSFFPLLCTEMLQQAACPGVATIKTDWHVRARIPHLSNANTAAYCQKQTQPRPLKHSHSVTTTTICCKVL